MNEKLSHKAGRVNKERSEFPKYEYSACPNYKKKCVQMVKSITFTCLLLYYCNPFGQRNYFILTN